jgi:hypothetical protein
MLRRWRYILCLAAALLVTSAASAAHAGTWLSARSDLGWHGYSWFEFNGFPVPAADLPVRLVLLGEPPLGMSVDEVEQDLSAAVQTWSSVSCASARVVYAGQRATLEDLRPGEVPIYFSVPELTPCFPEGTIGWTALTCSGGFPDKSIFLNVNVYDWAGQPRPFQPAYTDPQSQARLTVDVESVVTHEIGHVLGLSHTEDPLATMFASYRGDGGQRSLAVDDKLGLCTLYRSTGSPDECSSGRDCSVDEACERVDGMDLCRERRGEPGDACALDRLVCPEACVLPESQGQFGYCTSTCADNGPSCPERFQCVEGLLRAGESHCEQVAGLEQPSCSANGRRAGWPPALAWIWVLASVVSIRLTSWLRCS